ncbi:hypothetical protein [Mucilaginibacter sp. L196]|uniref:hypothetical protein n=1 Tax=Mucilaginibacter sp. L196 TaxID=1641870 RepID=UPI001C202251|nr:hypothetical protein [Mucilaginibacter sp. L196]
MKLCLVIVLVKEAPHQKFYKYDKRKVIKRNMKTATRPNLKSKQFSTLHIEIFEQLLISGKTNWELNKQFGYTKRSHCIVDHSRKVMYKLLALEKLTREDNMEKVIYPRIYKFWWKRLLDNHRQALLAKAIIPVYYENMPPEKINENVVVCYKTVKTLNILHLYPASTEH